VLHRGREVDPFATCGTKSPASDSESLLALKAAVVCVAASKCVVSSVVSGVLIMHLAGPLVLKPKLSRRSLARPTKPIVHACTSAASPMVVIWHEKAPAWRPSFGSKGPK
jgi:hypothetical protein